jgi:hypothetical protein
LTEWQNKNMILYERIIKFENKIDNWI